MVTNHDVCSASRPMEPSGVWKNLLSGKQAVPTVACPSCGAEVPEFRIHSHLDTCLTILISEEEAAAPPPHVGELVHELSDGGEQNHHRRGRAVGARGQGRGRGRGRKRREAAEKKGRDGETGRKRTKNDMGSGDNVEGEKELDVPALDDDDYASFYQHWEYSVAGLDELAKSRKDVRLSDLQKQELLSSGVLTIERHAVSAMVLQLDRLLADFQTTEGTTDVSSTSFRVKSRVHSGNGFLMPAPNRVGVPEQGSDSTMRLNTADADGKDGTQADQGKALEAWWEQWVTVEWPEGPLPSGFHAGLPQRLESVLRAAQDVLTDTENVGMGRSAAQETAAISGHCASAMNSMSILNFSESGGIIGGKSGVVPHSSELLNKSSRRQTIQVGMQSGSKTFRGEQSIPAKATELISHSKPSIGHTSVAESLARRAGSPSTPSKAPASNPAGIVGTSPGLQACPICTCPFPPETSNKMINEHLDQCLTEMACQFD